MWAKCHAGLGINDHNPCGQVCKKFPLKGFGFPYGFFPVIVFRNVPEDEDCACYDAGRITNRCATVIDVMFSHVACNERCAVFKIDCFTFH